MNTLRKQALAHAVSIIYLLLIMFAMIQILMILACEINNQFNPNALMQLFGSLIVILIAQILKRISSRFLACTHQAKKYRVDLHTSPSAATLDVNQHIHFDPWLDEWYGEGPWWKKW